MTKEVRKRSLLFSLVSTCIATWSCVPIPPSDSKPFEEQSLNFLRIGETSRDEAQAYFAKDSAGFEELRFENDAVRIYSGTADTWSIFWCAISPCGPGCGYLLPPRKKKYYLILRFNEAGLLTRFDVSEYGCDMTAGFCATYKGQETMTLDTNRGLRIPSTVANSDETCTFYLYTSGPAWTTSVLSVTFDGEHVGCLIEEPGYFQLVASSGRVMPNYCR